MKNEPFIFILSWNRPLYLWTCLDSIYRHTKTPCKIVIADNHSADPLVKKVIEGFDRRGMFHAVHFFEENDPQRLHKLYQAYKDEVGDFFVFIEGDIEILPLKEGCWLAYMMEKMRKNKRLASLGSRVYQDDFVSLEKAKKLAPDLREQELKFLIKADAPMRQYQHKKRPELIDPHNAPLRLLMLRKTAFEQVEFGQDFQLYNQFKAQGWDAKISRKIVHRHLSLLNIFDYPSYSEKDRDQFFNQQL